MASDEYNKAEERIRASYVSPEYDNNPFATSGGPKWLDELICKPLPPDEVKRIFTLLHNMHTVYDQYMDGNITTMEEHQVIIDHMHLLLDEAIDVLQPVTEVAQEN